jgi:hypothetical protein
MIPPGGATDAVRPVGLLGLRARPHLQTPRFDERAAGMSLLFYSASLFDAAV